MAITGHPTLLAVLLERKGLKRYGSFGPAYENEPGRWTASPAQRRAGRSSTGG